MVLVESECIAMWQKLLERYQSRADSMVVTCVEGSLATPYGPGALGDGWAGASASVVTTQIRPADS